jgi:hypothetical protein
MLSGIETGVGTGARNKRQEEQGPLLPANKNMDLPFFLLHCDANSQLELRERNDQLLEGTIHPYISVMFLLYCRYAWMSAQQRHPWNE